MIQKIAVNIDAVWFRQLLRHQLTNGRQMLGLIFMSILNVYQPVRGFPGLV